MSGSEAGNENRRQPVTVPEIPVGSSQLAQGGDPFQLASPPQSSPGWGATTTNNQGDVVASGVAPPAPTSATDGNQQQAGTANRLAGILNPAKSTTANLVATPPSTATSSYVSTGSWDVVSVRAAPTASRTLLGGAVVPKTSLAVAGARSLSMGRSVVLGKGPPVAINPSQRKKACIDKRRGAILFCIEGVDWPAELENAMQVDTVMYQGLNAIVRYDNGVATRFHALFPSESYNAVVSYYMQRLGNPSNVWRRTISPLAAPERENPTISWQALNPLTQTTSILEIRQFDDTRGGFPDEKRGAVTLYSAQSGPIFPQVSAFELMRLQPAS